VSEPTDIAELIRKFGEMGKLSLCIDAADELDRLRRRLDIARKYFVRIQHEGDGHSHWIASTALEAMRKAGEA
jgi:hypothetical protein